MILNKLDRTVQVGVAREKVNAKPDSLVLHLDLKVVYHPDMLAIVSWPKLVQQNPLKVGDRAHTRWHVQPPWHVLLIRELVRDGHGNDLLVLLVGPDTSSLLRDDIFEDGFLANSFNQSLNTLNPYLLLDLDFDWVERAFPSSVINEDLYRELFACNPRFLVHLGRELDRLFVTKHAATDATLDALILGLAELGRHGGKRVLDKDLFQAAVFGELALEASDPVVLFHGRELHTKEVGQHAEPAMAPLGLH